MPSRTTLPSTAADQQHSRLAYLCKCVVEAMCTRPTVHRSNCTSNVTQPWLGQSEVATYHNKRLLCEPGVEILSCHNPSRPATVCRCARGAVGSFQSSRRRKTPSGLAKGPSVAPAQEFGHFTSVSHRPNGRRRKNENRPPYPQGIQATYQGPSAAIFAVQ